MARLSVQRQAAILAQRFPALRPLFVADWGACWQGPLRGADQPYLVNILYLTGDPVGGCRVDHWFPEVRVLDPPLLPSMSGEPPPHLYTTNGKPVLCLFDPRADEWDQGRSIADTIIPWAAEWLFHYELWHATGIWAGVGRHPGPSPQRPAPCSIPNPLTLDEMMTGAAPLAPFTGAGPHFPGPRIESSESCP